MKDFSKLILSVACCESVGFLSIPFTISSIPTWYVTLNKPFFAPPSWVFGPVWTILYFLMGVAFYLIWKKGLDKKRVKNACLFFLGQLMLNFIWTPIFFGLRSPLLALIVILLMLVLIVITMKKFYPITKLAFYFLVPYVVWVSFAALINGAIVLLN